MRGLLIALVLLASASPAAAAPRVTLYTIGVADDVFSAYGHAAICVSDEASPRGRCYSYGTADFANPGPLIIGVLRGNALFWASVISEPTMLEAYASAGRIVYRQPLPLSDAEANQLRGLLARSAEESAKYYRYHHFHDNCTTRIRDLVDQATGGRLSAARGVPGPSFRDWARTGVAGRWPLWPLVDLLVGRDADRPVDRYAALFLPDELRCEVARRLQAPATLIDAGRPRPPRAWLGRPAFLLLGLGLAALLWLTVGLGRFAHRTALALTGALLGGLGLAMWLLAALSTFPELVYNENLLVFWPTDLWLPLLPLRRRARYLALRLAALALTLSWHLGPLLQPLGPLLLLALPLGAALFSSAREQRRLVAAGDERAGA